MDDFIKELSNHISDLIDLGKTLAFDKNVDDLEIQGFDLCKDRTNAYYWRGADIQVIKSLPGDSHEQFIKSVVDVGYSYYCEYRVGT